MKALVTGGGGFLGGRIARMLRAEGHEVLVVGRRHYPKLQKLGIHTLRADIRKRESVLVACRHADIVYHVAGKTGVWGSRSDFWDINLEGTRHVIEACLANGISKLVYTSSPSVAFGKDALCGVDESQPYPRQYLCNYAESKAAAERLVLAMNSDALATVALRPHLIWGPGDPHLVPRILDRARRGRLVRIGDGQSVVDITYIDNAARAHVQAGKRLSVGAACAGKAYFISQGDPVVLWSWIDDLLKRVGMPPVRRSISFSKAHAIGTLLECTYRLLRLSNEPPLTRFVVTQLARSHYFDIQAARRDLGYKAEVSNEEGMKALIQSLKKPM